ncbi:iron complex transport system permease protein [Ruegeria halocynthiae]|uniref:Iron complex transport system permease protein n=1 Tax=Ruegeria halocynthiae TaxID=985054 RepID=A0A1H2XY70_9RHOB|nr:iron ABC transporter permease [Ruegeria halocynthiae]SDW97827.1 iron complex transport system permease protein [Ruegeria halocynthiae]
MTAHTASVPSEHPGTDARGRWLGASVLGLIVLSMFALRFGVRPTGWGQIWSAFTAFQPLNPEHIVIREIRLPRLIGAILAGSSLGMAGALMQGMTRNPLADPGLLGVNAGASMGVVVCILIFGMTDPADFVWIALGGGLVAALLVYLLGGGNQANPARLILAGAAVSALFLALSRSLLLVSQQTLDVYRFWVLGGFDGIEFSTILTLLPFIAFGLALAIPGSLVLNALMLGEDMARGLGVRVGLAQGLIGLAIVILCGATVSMAGPIAFVGLIVPHLARRIGGSDMRWMLFFSAGIGALLMVAADLLGRLPLFGGNMQAGVMAALIGGPVLIWLVRRNGVSKL